MTTSLTLQQNVSAVSGQSQLNQLVLSRMAAEKPLQVARIKADESLTKYIAETKDMVRKMAEKIALQEQRITFLEKQNKESELIHQTKEKAKEDENQKLKERINELMKELTATKDDLAKKDKALGFLKIQWESYGPYRSSFSGRQQREAAIRATASSERALGTDKFQKMEPLYIQYDAHLYP